MVIFRHPMEMVSPNRPGSAQPDIPALRCTAQICGMGILAMMNMVNWVAKRSSDVKRPHPRATPRPNRLKEPDHDSVEPVGGTPEFPPENVLPENLDLKEARHA